MGSPFRPLRYPERTHTKGRLSIMESITQRARAEQQKHFEEHPEMANTEVATITTRLYDAVDTMTPDQRSLLAREVLGRLHSLVFSMVQQFPQTSGVAQVASALTGIGGYAVEVQREEDGLTATSDRAVEGIMDDVKALLRASAAAQFGEDADKMEAITERVNERVASGEQFDTVVREELDKAGLGQPATAQATAAEARPDDGLYL